MLLKYSVIDNALTADPEDKKANVNHGKPVSLEEIIDLIVFRHSTVSKSDAMAALEEFFVHFERLLMEGRPVHVPIGTFKLSIKGRFNGSDDVFDNNRHRVDANFSLNKVLRRSLQDLSMEKVDYTKPAPMLKNYYDSRSAQTNSVISAGGGGRITGRNLKFDPTDVNQGLFLVNGAGTVKVSEFLSNAPSELMFVLDDTLPAGDYTPEVRAIAKGSITLRTGRMSTKLVVS